VNFSKTPIALKEHLVYSDMDGSLFHFIIENSTFVDASKIPPEVTVGLVETNVFRTELIFTGFVCRTGMFGNLCESGVKHHKPTKRPRI
jgi:hypothetical protein